MDAEDLYEGAQVRSFDSDYGIVENIEFLNISQRMYNLTVEEAHTFFVGEEGWLVHNDGYVTPSGIPIKLTPYGGGGKKFYLRIGEPWQYTTQEGHQSYGGLPDWFNSWFQNANGALLPNINGSIPQNAKYAGRNYSFEEGSDLALRFPSGVDFNHAGFPIFDPYALVTLISDDFNGKADDDFVAANTYLLELYGYDPSNYTKQELQYIHQQLYPNTVWHHHQDGKTLQLIDNDLHQKVSHTGGEAIHKCR